MFGILHNNGTVTVHAFGFQYGMETETAARRFASTHGRELILCRVVND